MKKGDPITLVFLEHVELREVLLAADELDYVLAGPHRLQRADEGVTWVKGWHKPDHEYVSAARTCQVLREKEAPIGQGQIVPTVPIGGPYGGAGSPYGIPVPSAPYLPPLPYEAPPPFGEPWTKTIISTSSCGDLVLKGNAQ